MVLQPSYMQRIQEKCNCRFLAKNKALVDICNNEGWNAVVGAFANGNTEIVEKLLASGAHFQESYAQAALLNSYLNGNIKVAKSLLENGVSPNFTDKKSECLLIVALEKVIMILQGC